MSFIFRHRRHAAETPATDPRAELETAELETTVAPAHGGREYDDGYWHGRRGYPPAYAPRWGYPPASAYSAEPWWAGYADGELDRLGEETPPREPLNRRPEPLSRRIRA